MIQTKTKVKKSLIISEYLEDKIKELQEQLRIKDSQIDRISQTKDNQIEKLIETIQAQVIHIQTLLNQKAIETPRAKKPWWKI